MEDEIMHFQQLDIEKLKADKELKALEIKERAKVDRIATEVALVKAKSRAVTVAGFRIAGAWLLGVSIVSGVVAGANAMWWSGPPKSPEIVKLEQKQDRFKKCISDKSGLTSEGRNIWYPEANNGDGQCLPKEKPAPTN